MVDRTVPGARGIRAIILVDGTASAGFEEGALRTVLETNGSVTEIYLDIFSETLLCL